jgi:hypothetical protein
VGTVRRETWRSDAAKAVGRGCCADDEEGAESEDSCDNAGAVATKRENKREVQRTRQNGCGQIIPPVYRAEWLLRTSLWRIIPHYRRQVAASCPPIRLASPCLLLTHLNPQSKI